jgi:hypothetical protein
MGSYSRPTPQTRCARPPDNDQRETGLWPRRRRRSDEHSRRRDMTERSATRGTRPSHPRPVTLNRITLDGAQHERSHNDAVHIGQRGRLTEAIHDTVDLRLVRDVAPVDRRAA